MRRQALAIRERCIVPDFRELLWEIELYAILVNALHRFGLQSTYTQEFT